jgi:streptomycin 6-kinase
MLRPLAGQPVPGAGLPPISDWLRDRLTAEALADVPIGERVASEAERKSALRVLDALVMDEIKGLCHGDASPWNVLTGEEGGFYLVDPRGMAGEVAYDVAVIALKAAAHVPPLTGAAELAEHAGVDPNRACAWVEVASAARV